MKRQILSFAFLLLGLPAAGFALGEPELGRFDFVPSASNYAGVPVQVILREHSQYLPPPRLLGVLVVGQEIRFEILRPITLTPAPAYEFSLSADLPPLPAGTYVVRGYNYSAPGGPPEGPVAERTLQIQANGVQLTYAGTAEPTSDDEIVLRLSQRPCNGLPAPRVELADFHLRLRADGCFTPAAQGYELPVGKLAAGSWIIDLEPADGGIYDQIELEVLPPPVQGVVLANDFEVEVLWRNAAGETGPGRLVQPPSQDSALFYFFSPDNWELMVKVLDGCAINGHYWVFGAASTDVAYTVDIRRRNSAQTFRAENPLGVAAQAITAIEAFPCDPAALVEAPYQARGSSS